MKKNDVAQALQVYAILNAIAGIFLGFSLMQSLGTGTGIIVIAAVAVSSFVIYAFGEIIQLLQNISDNTRHTTSQLGTLNSSVTANQDTQTVEDDLPEL